MKANHAIIHYSLFAALIGLSTFNANAALRVGNHSRAYSQAYQQINALQNTAATVPIVTTPSTDTENNLPVRVADEELVQQITSGSTNTPVAYNQLEQCSMIYPNGEFAWDAPTIGMGVGGADTCVAVVELRGYQAAADGSDLVLARAQLAAGDSFKCNISSFPESTMIVSAVENFTFPADAAPTTDDVIAQMNKEQKKNAGLKIAAAAIIGGIGGNMAGANEPGNDSLLGTSDSKIKSTVIGALGGGAVGAGNAYAGKVAGDVILSTSVNAAAASLVGNMAGTGKDVLRIEDCDLVDRGKTSCLWGVLATAKPVTDKEAYYEIYSGETYLCDNNKGCEKTELISIELEAYKGKDIESITDDFEKVAGDSSLQYFMQVKDGKIKMVAASDAIGDQYVDANRGTFAKISKASTIDREIPAMIEMHDKAFGMTKDDWREWKKNNGSGVNFYYRTISGTASIISDESVADINNFYPMMLSAEDGSLIDFGNKARLKSTLIGAGVGGALGALSGYQGAQSDIQNRWVTAVREYEDSLSKVYCATGTRYLSKYNDNVYIPQMTPINE